VGCPAAQGVAVVRVCLVGNLLALEEDRRIFEKTFLLGDCLGMLAALRPRRSVLLPAVSIEAFTWTVLLLDRLNGSASMEDLTRAFEPLAVTA
jgi:hypothetical protein